MDTSRRGALGRLALIGATLLWGSSFVVLKTTIDSVPTLWVLAIRFTGAAVLMGIPCLKQLRKIDRGCLKPGRSWASCCSRPIRCRPSAWSAPRRAKTLS